MRFNGLRDGGVALCFLVLMLMIAMKVNGETGKTFTDGYRVVDGDSLARDRQRLRLLGIDAPELHQTCMRGGETWRCGEFARQALAALMDGRTVTCKGSHNDKYGRLLVACRSGKADINAEMVRKGWAVGFGAYEREEAEAKAERAGLWSSDFQRPGDWRRAHKASMADESPHLPSMLRKLFGLE